MSAPYQHVFNDSNCQRLLIQQTQNAETAKLSYETLCIKFHKDIEQTIPYMFNQKKSIACKLSQTFVDIGRTSRGGNACPDSQYYRTYKLKFHVSLPEYHQNSELYIKAWDIISTILIAEGVYFKVVRPGYNMSDVLGQEGKDITVFPEKTLDKSFTDWQRIFQLITEQLTAEKITPGVRPSGEYQKEMALQGSNYVSYRYDTAQWPEDDQVREKIKVNVSNQLPLQQIVNHTIDSTTKVVNK